MAERGFFSALVCVIFFCGQPFEILDVYCQKFYAGRKEAGGGINYELTIIPNVSSKKLSFNCIIAANDTLILKIQNEQGKFISRFRKGDTLTINASLIVKNLEIDSAINTISYQQIQLLYIFKEKPCTLDLQSQNISTKSFQ